MNNTLIIFARRPELGKVKTRLARDMGSKKALEIYTQLLKKTIDTAKKSISNVKFYWSEKTDSTFDYIQKGEDLGERMYNALKDEMNTNKVCLIGTDTPLITSFIIDDTFAALDNFDIVFGPSKDGGYYLVAINKKLPVELFKHKSWGHKDVLKDAMSVCKALNLSAKLMPTLLDIDTLEDYNSWQKTK